VKVTVPGLGRWEVGAFGALHQIGCPVWWDSETQIESNLRTLLGRSGNDGAEEDDDTGETQEQSACGSCEPGCDGPHYCNDPDEYIELFNNLGSCLCECHEFYHTADCQYGHDDTEENPDNDPGHEQCQCGCHIVNMALGDGWLGMDN
jgi:hypothetical protein